MVGSSLINFMELRPPDKKKKKIIRHKFILQFEKPTDMIGQKQLSVSLCFNCFVFNINIAIRFTSRCPFFALVDFRWVFLQRDQYAEVNIALLLQARQTP